MAFTLDISAIGIALLIVFLLHKQFSKVTNGTPYPPGPPKIPFFGNLFQVPVLRPYPTFRKWAQKYGPIYHLRLGPQDVIVLNTAEAADELFVNRSRSFSSRSPPHVAHDIMSAGQRMVFLPYEKEWKAARKSLHNAIGPNAAKRLRPFQDLESCVCLHDMMTHGNSTVENKLSEARDGGVSEAHWFSLIRRYTTSVVMTVTYGKRIDRVLNNPRLHKIYDVLANFTVVGQPGNYLADAFPIFRKLPDILASWRVKARKMHEWEMELWGGLLKDIQTDIDTGVATSCFVGDYLKDRADHGHVDAPGCGLTDDGWLKDTLLAYTAGTVLEAGSDTTASTMQSFILFMLSHPAVYAKVRSEMDSVVGPDRMPTFDDEPNLPYLVACIKETLRKRPPTIMGIPHSADQDEVYNGYFIPKGATVIGNVWAIHMDPTRYPNPTAYQPERWYTPGKPTRWGSGPDTDRDHYVFGWGRRFCQGSYIAEASLFIVLSRLVWGIDFQAPTDPTTGKVIIPDIADDDATYTDGFVSIPKPYGVTFKARSEAQERIIRRAFVEAQDAWKDQGMVVDER